MPVTNAEDVTQLTDIEVDRHDGVKTPASGYKFLIIKSSAAKDVNSVGGIDEKPDISGAESVLQQLARLIASEANEMAVGAWDETCDIHLLLECASLMRCFRDNEMWGDTDDGYEMAKSAVLKSHRKFSSDERSELSAKGHALPDGSYPIPDADALHRAAILAKSGHGDVAAAKRLIAKRAKELGVPNPMADTAKKEKMSDTETTAPEGAENVDEVTKDSIQKMIDDAVAEVTKAAEERAKALAAELDVLKATPIPGQVVLAAPALPKAEQKSELLAKAAYFRRQAENTSDRELIQFYTDKARQAETAAG